MKDLKQFIKTTLREFLNESLEPIKTWGGDNLGDIVMVIDGNASELPETQNEDIPDGEYVLSIIPINKTTLYMKGLLTRDAFKKDDYDGWQTEHLNDIKKSFDSSNRTPIIVLENKDGNYFVIDGHHRLTIANEIGRETINENIFDKIEDLVKGKSDKGKIVEEFLTKNGIQSKGTIYMIHFLGGSTPGKTELSHPFDYLHYTPGVAKITEDGVLELRDEKVGKLQTPDTLSFLSVMEKDMIAKNWTFGLKQGSSVKKGDYQFDLSKDIPTLNIKESMWSMTGQKWNPLKDEEIQLDGDGKEFDSDEIVSFKTTMKMITLQQWVDQLNATGWVKKDTKYFREYIK